MTNPKTLTTIASALVAHRFAWVVHCERFSQPHPLVDDGIWHGLDIPFRRQVGAVDLFDRVLERPAEKGGARRAVVIFQVARCVEAGRRAERNGSDRKSVV